MSTYHICIFKGLGFYDLGESMDINFCPKSDCIFDFNLSTSIPAKLILKLFFTLYSLGSITS